MTCLILGLVSLIFSLGALVIFREFLGILLNHDSTTGKVTASRSVEEKNIDALGKHYKVHLTITYKVDENEYNH